MKKDGKVENYTWFDHLLAGLIAFPFIAVIHIVAALFRKVIWPLLQFVISKASNPVSLERPVVSHANNLPTPDVFKNAPNLAPAKQLKL